MDLYRLTKNKKLELIETTKFDLEKDIQSVIENHTQELFNLQFVTSEFSINGYRLDTLCFNQETNSFVIIEYKNTNSYSVVDQGFTYLSTMLNNKSDFVLEYNEVTGTNLKRDQIDWSQSRVIFVSPSFSQYQKDSVNFKDIPFELWEVKKYSDDLVGLKQLTSNSRQSMKGLEKSKDKVLSEVEVFDEDSVFQKSSKNVQNIYEEIKEKMLTWNDVSFNSKKNYVSVLRGNKVKIYLVPQKNQLKIDMVRRIDFKGNVQSIPIKFTLDDPKNIFKLLVNEYKELYTLSLDDNKNIDYILLLMKQKFDS
jgi:predicted transport protein